VDEVVCRLGIPADMTRVVLVNGKDAEPGHRLGPGDSIAIFPPLMGGRGERRRGG
jgi:molybdopterin converting factor small subunit